MKVKKICDSYREERGDYEVELKRGETLRIYGEGGLVSHGSVSNILAIKCGDSVFLNDWVDLKIKRVIEVEK